MKTILITGASGFVGSYLANHFLNKGYHIVGTGTSAIHPFENKSDRFTWISADTSMPGPWQDHMAGADLVVNLAGCNIFKPWTRTYKEAIYRSRILTTKNLVSAMADDWSGKFFTASALGYYGDRGDTLLSETDPSGTDFLARVCRDWETQALKASEQGIKVSVMRFGVVLGDGGALTVMEKVFRCFVGGLLGSGQQYFPWIHIHDLARAVELLMAQNQGGVFNFTGPVPLCQKEFAIVLGSALSRPAFMPAPGFIVKLAMGELGALLLQGQRALPTRLDDLGFEFLYPNVPAALEQIYHG